MPAPTPEIRMYKPPFAVSSDPASFGYKALMLLQDTLWRMRFINSEV
jgi:hypothetical protein